MPNDTRPPLVVTPGYSLYNTPPRPVNWLVEGLIPVESMWCLNGRGGTFKSWTMTAMGIAIASAHLGAKFMGHFPCPVRGPRNSVLFIELEESRTQASKKYQWLLRGMEAGPEQIQDLLMAFVVSQPIRVDRAEDFERIKIAIDQTKPDLVLWDNVRRMKLGNNNDSEWAGALAEQVKEMQNIFPSSHGLVHHWRKKASEKSMNDADEMGSGTAALRDACDVWLPIEMDETEILTMRQTKNRDAEKYRPFNYRVRIVDHADTAEVIYSGTATTSQAGEPNAADAILDILHQHPERPVSRPDLARMLAVQGFSGDQVRRAVEALRQRQEIYVRKGAGGSPVMIILIKYAALLPDDGPGDLAGPGAETARSRNNTPYNDL